MSDQSRYGKLIEHIFLERYESGADEVSFERTDFMKAARDLNIDLPKNLGDIVYSFVIDATFRIEFRNAHRKG